jgi:glycosyltransferase involved in cell wall biosynthesis
MADTVVVMPAFNEEDRIAGIIAQLRAVGPDWDILVIDDGSADQTAAAARRAGALVVEHPFNLGYGAALQTAYMFARDHGYRIALQMDADGQHPPEEAPKLLGPVLAGEADMVIGSRFMTGGGGYEVPLTRRIGIGLFGGLARLLTGEPMTDVTSGFAAMGRRAILLFAGDRFPADYPDADVRLMLHKIGLKVDEVPITMRAGPPGKSMHAGLLTMWYVVKMMISMLIVWITKFEPPEEETP